MTAILGVRAFAASPRPSTLGEKVHAQFCVLSVNVHAHKQM